MPTKRPQTPPKRRHTPVSARRATNPRVNTGMEMISADNASSGRNDVSSKPPISPAAQKFADYLARRMAPQIEHAGRQSTTSTPHTNR
jgi:hypothetical protein